MVRPIDIPVHTNNLLLLLARLESASIDLSKATRLTDVALLSGRSGAQWVVRALRTITPDHRNLQRIILRVPWITHFYPTLRRSEPVNIRHAIGETTYRQWLELDRLLAQLYESHSIRPKVQDQYAEGVSSCVETLLPEVTKRGIVGLVD